MAESGRSQGIVLADTEGIILHWDEGAETLFGFASDDAIGQTLDLIIPERHRERHWAAFNEAMEKNEAKNSGAASVLPTLHADGESARHPARFIFLQDAAGNAAGAIAIFTEPDD